MGQIGQHIEIDDETRANIAKENLKYIVEQTFSNATASEKKQLVHMMRRFHPARLDGLRALVDKGENEAARGIILQWL